MVPRTKISALNIDTPLNEVITVVAQSPYSRLPVYRDSLDNIVGIVHTKDLVRWLVSDGVEWLADLADPSHCQRARERDRRSHPAAAAREAVASGAGRR